MRKNLDQTIAKLISLICNKKWNQIRKLYLNGCDIYYHASTANIEYPCTTCREHPCTTCREHLKAIPMSLGAHVCPIRQLVSIRRLDENITEDQIAEIVIGLLSFKAEILTREDNTNANSA